MAKRVADKQLNQDNQYDEDADASGEQTDGGFRMADKETLSRRVIKVPKSRLRNAGVAIDAGSSNQSSDSANTPASAPKPTPAFSGFGGFVAPKPAETKDATASAASANTETSKGSGLFKGFSFGQPAGGDKPAFGAATGGFKIGSFGSAGGSTAVPAAKDSAGVSIDKKKEGAPASGFTMTSFKPPAAAAAGASSSATSSLFNASPKKPSFSSGFVPPSSNAVASTKSASATTIASPSAASATGGKQGSDDSELYKNIRGLNVSLQKKISDAMEINAFVDLTPLLEQYNGHWQKITKGSSATATEAGANKADPMSQKPQATKPVAAAQSMTSVSAASAKPAFTFGASSSPLETKSSTAETVRIPDAAASPVRSSMFASLDKPASKPSDTTSPTPAKPTGFTFGSSGNINNSSGSTTATAPPPPAAAAAAALSSTGFSFSFGKPASGETKDGEEAKKPFSFGFAKGTGFGANSGALSTGDTTKPAFSFGFGGGIKSSASADGADAQTKGANGQDDDNDADQDEEKEDEDDGAGQKEPTTAGEEGETTEHTVRSKLYMWDSDSKQYKDLGIGNFKVNTWTVEGGGKRGRVLCRQEGSDKITLNAAMFKEMQVENTAGKKEVGILVVDDGKPTRFLVRVKNAEFARSLYNVIEKVRNQL
ncbi:hypothetical protein LPJ56_000710 [Coemansia sp. RSA 2599]|nr:hypothetical protein LPJ75_000370 [Coemansia sp. RSA 2598]KAJ1829019.1 hypothetical protein LPJ56_000710 [Coemansia sp. RSA 2599]